MAALVAILGIGGYAFGGQNGFLLFAGIGLVANFFSYWFSDRLALMSNRTRVDEILASWARPSRGAAS